MSRDRRNTSGWVTASRAVPIPIQIILIVLASWISLLRVFFAITEGDVYIKGEFNQSVFSNLHYNKTNYYDRAAMTILSEKIIEPDKMTKNTNGENIVLNFHKTNQSEGFNNVQNIHFNNKRIPSYNIETPKHPPHTPGAFIHIGKTGGSTLSLLLRNGCHSTVPKPCPSGMKNLSNESYASLLTTYYHKPDFTNGKLSKHSYEFYILSVRDPLLRTISAFLYEHPENIIAEIIYRNKITRPGAKRKVAQKIRKMVTGGDYDFYYECFPTLEIFASYFGNDMPAHDKITNTEDCAHLADKVLTENSRRSHLFWNYENIVSLMKKGGYDNSVDILVVRNEFKWEDWITTNVWLGQEGFIATHPRVIGRNSQEYNMPVTKYISKAGRENICRALKKEYSIYLQLLKNSANLRPKEIQDSLRIAREKCPNLKLEIE